jgi:hypothetical protein
MRSAAQAHIPEPYRFSDQEARSSSYPMPDASAKGLSVKALARMDFLASTILLIA